MAVFRFPYRLPHHLAARLRVVQNRGLQSSIGATIYPVAINEYSRYCLSEHSVLNSTNPRAEAG